MITLHFSGDEGYRLRHVSERNRYLIALVLLKTSKNKRKKNKNALKVHILPIVFEREIIAKEKKLIRNRVSALYLVSKLFLVTK